MANTNQETSYKNTCLATIKSSSRITSEDTDEIREITLSVDDPAFRAIVGQNIGVLVSGPHPFGNQFHHRYYTIARAKSVDETGDAEIEILVRRCSYIDEVSGEEYPGIASTLLSDAKPGDSITITGPYKAAFKVPEDKNSNLLMIGTGTGVAPFRTLIKSIYDTHKDWKGQVRLFYGAKSGLDMLYMNDKNSDLTNYYDEDTFKAYQAINAHPMSNRSDALGDSIEENSAETWALIQEPSTYVFLAGIKKQVAVFEEKMAKIAGSIDEWNALKSKMINENRWVELTYH